MRFFGILAALVLWAIPALAGDALPPAEQAYADWLDAAYAVSTLSSGAVPLIDGRGQTRWQIWMALR